MRDDDRIVKLLGQLRDAVAKRITDLNRSLEAEEQAVAARVEERKQLAGQLQLPGRLRTIYNEVKYYPHRAQSRPMDVCPLITDVEVREESIHKATIRFSLKNRYYSFLFDEKELSVEGYEGYSASLTLGGANGEALFQWLWLSSMSRSLMEEYGMGETRGFVPGDWVLDFMELSEAIATIAIERNRRDRLSQIENQKKDFGLGVPKSEVQKLRATLGSHGIGEEHRSAGTAARATGRWLRRLFACIGGSEKG